MKAINLILGLIIFIAGASAANGVTRFYLPSTGAAEVTPAFSASWNLTTSADQLRCTTVKQATTMTNKVTANSSSVQNILNRQYVSDPIAGQTISGTVNGQVRGRESNNAMNGFSSITIRVVSNDGTTVRGTPLAITTGATEYSTAVTNRNTPISSALTSVNAQNGDRIVIEIGARQMAASTNRNVTQSFGDDSATDLAVDETTTTADNPWVEFSGDIKFPRASIVE